MKWELHVDKNCYCSRLGIVSPPYRIGKFSSGLGFVYRLWFEDEFLAEKKTFEECQEVADKHAGALQVIEGRT